MKKIVYMAALASGLFACQSDPTQSEQYKQLQGDEKRTEETVAQRDSSINDMFASFNRITENLQAIREKQGGLGKAPASGEMGKDAEQRILSDIRAMDSLLTVNKGLIAKLRKEGKNNAGKISELEKAIALMEQSIAQKDTEIAGLKEQLSSTNASLATMIQMYQDKEQQNNMQRDDLNTAYYCVGTQKELRANGVLTKEGGVIGIGSVNKLNTAGLNMDYFKRVDISQTTEIPIGAKKAKVVSTHPTDSYELVGTVDKLVIKDAAKFWSVNKYLVVVVD